MATILGPFLIATVEQTLCDSAGRLGARLDDVVVAAVEAGSVTPESVIARAMGLLPAPPRGLARLMTLAEERLDVLVPSWRLIVEADGRRWHTRRADFENDRRRDHIALANGHRTVRFTYDQLVHDVLLAAGAGSSSAAA